ncbi:hypothetical protein [Granulicella aggregans]|nr:hypothetical protein [Granulicella aggregans]
MTRLSTAESMALVVLNVLGAIGYDIAASRGGWKIPEEVAAGINVTTGEPFIWFISILPIVAAFFVINVTWGVCVLRRQRWKAGLYWIIAAAVWLGAVVIDFRHH